MSDEWETWLSRHLNHGDVDALNRVQVELSPGSKLGVGDVLRAWWEHVVKLVADLSAEHDDRSVWGAHDFVAALIIRDRLAEGLLRLDPAFKRSAEAAVSEIDSIFDGYTEPDHDGCSERVDGRSEPGRSWWWQRIPKSGPVRKEIEQYYGHVPVKQ